MADKYPRGPAFYLRLWGALFWNTVQRSLEYRVNFFGRIFSELTFLCGQAVFALSLSSGGHNVGGWTPPELFLFFGAVGLTDALFTLFLHDNLQEFDSLIRQGTFDFHLLRPVNSLFLATLRFPNAVSAVNFVFSLGMIAYALHAMPVLPTGTAMALGTLYFGAGFLLVAALNVFVFSVGFWMTRSDMLVWLFFEFYRFSFRPDDFYFSWLRRILLTIFPAAFFISIPIKIFLGKDLPLWMWVAPWVFLVIAILVVPVLWRRGIARYEGALS